MIVSLLKILSLANITDLAPEHLEKYAITKCALTIDQLLESTHLYLEYNPRLHFRKEALYWKYQVSTSEGAGETEMAAKCAAFSGIIILGFQHQLILKGGEFFVSWNHLRKLKYIYKMDIKGEVFIDY